MSQDQPEFVAAIQFESLAVVGRMGRLLNNGDILSLGCFDPAAKLEESTWDGTIPGGGMFLWYHQYLREWFENRRGKSGILGVHIGCGYMYAVMKLTTRAGQEAAVTRLKEDVDALNQEFGTAFIVIVTDGGIASDYLT